MLGPNAQVEGVVHTGPPWPAPEGGPAEAGGNGVSESSQGLEPRQNGRASAVGRDQSAARGRFVSTTRGRRLARGAGASCRDGRSVTH